ncbi:MAG TPA: zinc ribbon domain-containing protein [Methanocorpusculum sp.]|nr:zinc ribbon domain-containing protein [Methanocorpusculum sp.]HJJ89618.1 zinc ribbon domain-containing protein [Methanocorpusculum sp.]HJK01019.1 zinc ribbon domain-containing protein [Methanocorpusculum sp.]HJK01751.1 zinc ribbon domain-containing protein [Methanocorpusculum sp.]
MALFAGSLLFTATCWFFDIPLFCLFLLFPLFLAGTRRPAPIQRCPVCGWETRGSENFCPNCGTRLESNWPTDDSEK